MDIQVDPKLFHDFHFKVAMSLKLPGTSRRVLEEFVDLDVNAEAIGKVIQRNQYFEYWLLNEIKSLGLKENTPKLTAAIALLGMQRTRDFVCALQILRMVGRRHPEMTGDGKLNFKPADFLKYALKTEEFLSIRRMPYGDTAYAAGLMFDVMSAVARELFEAPKPFEEYLGEVYKHGLKSARIGTEIAKNFKSFSYTKYVFAGCLIHDIGKLAMDLMFGAGPTSYATFRADVEKRPTSRHVRHSVEATRFGLTHEYYSAQMAHYFGMFREIEKAILFHHEPYILKTVNKELYTFASIIALASNMTNNFRVPKDVNDPIYASWFTPELKDFKIDPKILQTVAKTVGSERF